jgi:hypothetical protein
VKGSRVASEQFEANYMAQEIERMMSAAKGD